MESLAWIAVFATIGWMFAAYDAWWWRQAARDSQKLTDDTLALYERYQDRLDEMAAEKGTDHD